MQYNYLSKVDKIIWQCYRDIYSNSKPIADFDKLVEEAQLDNYDRKIIDFNSYTIDENLFNELVEKNYKGKRLNDFEKRSIKISLMLGCTPKFAR